MRGGRGRAAAAVCGVLLAGAVGCTSAGHPAAAGGSPVAGGLPSAGGVTGGAPVAGDGAGAVDPAETDARVVRMRERIEAADGTVPGSVRLVHREGAVGFLTWTGSDGRQCLGHTAGAESPGPVTRCDPGAPGPLAERPALRVVPDGRADARWYVQIDADREQVVGVGCGGEQLKVVPIGEEHFPEGGRRHYLVFSDWQLTGRPVARLLVDGGQQTEEPLEVPQEPADGGLPFRDCG
ncbi:hypothetical protein HUT16_26780 [Kitasatospora sp. NA04385]|uniref:hypothetical protein n=1 Tax=Kitasatospora sp. NA04385 TaxID=2742135 RepID=UPI001591891E|nr:hypothetical protein [Kitasatospora sp. NA04385]QKW22198.1 hypothetical protein HUT16_26780 [Kitasatospora sp. NA04385]